MTLKTLAGESKAEREQFVNSTLGLLMFETAPSFVDPKAKHQAVEGYCALAESCLLRTQVSASSRSPTKSHPRFALGRCRLPLAFLLLDH